MPPEAMASTIDTNESRGSMTNRTTTMTIRIAVFLRTSTIDIKKKRERPLVSSSRRRRQYAGSKPLKKAGIRCWIC